MRFLTQKSIRFRYNAARKGRCKAMGIRDTVRGKTKDECWEKLQHIGKELREEYYMERYSPVDKADAYEKMVWNEEKGEYELPFFFDN